jgi:hypothetical protein
VEPINWLAANLVECDECGLFLGYSPDAIECPNHNQDVCPNPIFGDLKTDSGTTERHVIG